MTLREYIENLNELAEKNPSVLDLIVVSSSDDEGNEYGPVHNEPTVGYYEDREFLEAIHSKLKPNAVCIN